MSVEKSTKTNWLYSPKLEYGLHAVAFLILSITAYAYLAENPENLVVSLLGKSNLKFLYGLTFAVLVADFALPMWLKKKAKEKATEKDDFLL